MTGEAAQLGRGNDGTETPAGLASCSFFFFFLFLGPLPMAYGGSEARGLIRAVATSLRHSHSNVGSEPRLQPTPQLSAMPDP